MIFDIDNLAEQIIKDTTARRWNNRTLPALGRLLPENEDPNVLFRNNWLARGQAFGLVASSGVGKSSMADQMAYHWSLGKPFLATPTRPLKISIIQAEDSDRDLQEQRDGMIRGMSDEGMGEDEINRAMNEVVFPTDFIGVQGEQFTTRLYEYQNDCKFDFIFINPLQRFFGGDVSKQGEVSQFCAKIDEILKGKESPCAIGIVMHTPKFHSGVKDGRQSVDDYAEYAMAGSQEWTAWVRAVINFQKHGDSDIYFDIKASKRGKRLGWTNADGEKITKRIFKHSDGYIYWREVTDKEEIDSIKESPSTTRGTKPKEALDIAKAAESVSANYKDAATGKSRKEFAEYFWNDERRKHVKSDWLSVFDHIASNAQDFGFEVVKIDGVNGRKFATLRPL